MYSNYRLFGSGYLPLLAFDDEMINDLSSSSQNRERGSKTQLSRNAILKAWSANKRHLRSISDPEALSNYGVRKEVTLRFDIVLMMWASGYFQATRESHTGLLDWTIPLTGEDHVHFPFWTVPTRDINAMIFTQAARLVLPLDHLFNEAGASSVEQPARFDVADRHVHRILGFYTAQMFCRLLIHSFAGEQMLDYEHWIWLPRCAKSPCSPWRMRSTAPGLGQLAFIFLGLSPCSIVVATPSCQDKNDRDFACTYTSYESLNL
ncbi:hypothetical protein AUP68_08527 [Ilyonectria robusta]